MFKIIQSNDSQTLAEALIEFYAHEMSVLTPFVVITPAKVLEEWLKKTIARKVGISTLFTTQFWGQYQWRLIADVLMVDAERLRHQGRAHEAMSVPEVAVLSQSVIQWRLFGFFMQVLPNHLTMAQQIATEEAHPVSFLMAGIAQVEKTGQVHILEQRLWQLCQTLSKLYVTYLTLRPDWLQSWAMGEGVDVLALIAQKDRLSAYLNTQSSSEQALSEDALEETPAWLVAHYQALEEALRYLWQELFAGVYQKRLQLEQRFWQVLQNAPNDGVSSQIDKVLPKCLYLFTVQQLPPMELEFLKRLSLYVDVVLLHFNPSKMFWADIVDEHWLRTQRIIRPEAVYLKEHGHGLLSRLGKESREVFAMLATLSGGEDEAGFSVIWEDRFVQFATAQAGAKPTLLAQLKQDILTLQDTDAKLTISQEAILALTDKYYQSGEWQLSLTDDSLAIHSCHSLKRQLEVARLLIGRWLNEPNEDGSTRRLSDIAIMLPDVQKDHKLIATVFGKGVGLDGLSLPARITGIADESVSKLWQAMIGFYQLTAGRCYAQEVYDWLMLPPLYTSFGLDEEGAKRACDLLERAGFVRGFDADHLKKDLAVEDWDYRYSLAFALDRLEAGLLIESPSTRLFYPFSWQLEEAQGLVVAEQTLGVQGISAEDAPIIEALCHLYEALDANKEAYYKTNTVLAWLEHIESTLIDRYFFALKQTDAMRSIFTAKNAMKASILANYHYERFGEDTMTHTMMAMPLQFVLESLQGAVESQQISAEPTEVITFGRFGALRGIDFGLIIMMDMNLSSFPRSQTHSRLDLMKAGVARRGDRRSEDDDNGAFLEALLSARQACWIFYTGQSVSGEVKPLPASPVSELVQFLKNVRFSEMPFAQSGNPVYEHLPTLIERWLIHEHAALPFHQSVFEMTKNNDIQSLPLFLTEALWHSQKRWQQLRPPAPIWQAVYQQMQTMHSDTRQRQAVVSLPNKKQRQAQLKLLQHPEALLAKWHYQQLSEVFTTGLSATQLAYALRNLARYYLSDKLAVTQLGELASADEALGLDGLSNYQVSQRLLDDEVQALWAYDDILPAGVARTVSLAQLQENTKALQAHFEKVMVHYALDNSLWCAVTEQGQCYVEGVVLTTKYPKNKQAIWTTIQASRASIARVFLAYIHHLCWQVVGEFVGAEDDAKRGVFGAIGSSVWQFGRPLSDEMNIKTQKFTLTGGCFGFAPMPSQVAKRVLTQFLYLLALAKHEPVALTISNALVYLAYYPEDGQIEPQRFKRWLPNRYGYADDECADNPYWQTLLAGTDPMTVLKDYVDFSVLYQHFLDSIYSLDADFLEE